jgi:hypothetical protein
MGVAVEGLENCNVFRRRSHPWICPASRRQVAVDRPSAVTAAAGAMDILSEQ